MRLFVAVWPPAELVDQLAALPRPDVAGVRWTRPDQWHVTLRFLGRVDDVDTVVEALSGVEVAAVEAVAGPAVGRFGQRVLHVPVDGLGPVADAVVGATAALGEPPEERPFNGHVTLARATGRGGRVDLRPLAGGPVAARWIVDELTLVSSDLHPHGARYTVVERFSLGSPPPR